MLCFLYDIQEVINAYIIGSSNSLVNFYFKCFSVYTQRNRFQVSPLQLQGHRTLWYLPSLTFLVYLLISFIEFFLCIEPEPGSITSKKQSMWENFVFLLQLLSHKNIIKSPNGGKQCDLQLDVLNMYGWRWGIGRMANSTFQNITT